MINSNELISLMQLVFYFKICSSLALTLQAAVSLHVGGPACTVLWASFVSVAIHLILYLEDLSHLGISLLSVQAQVVVWDSLLHPGCVTCTQAAVLCSFLP